MRKRTQEPKLKTMATLWSLGVVPPQPSQTTPPPKPGNQSESAGPFLQDLAGQYVMFLESPHVRWRKL